MQHKIPNTKQIKTWKKTWNQYKNQLKPNKKEGKDLLAFIKNNYSIEYIDQGKVVDVALSNLNEIMKTLLSNFDESEMDSKVLKIVNKDKGIKLYDNQETIFKGLPILVALDLKTGYFIVDGSGQLHDELTSYSGLTKAEIENFYLVASYIESLERLGKLDEIIK